MNFGTTDDLEIVGLVNHHPGAVGDPPSTVDFDAQYILDSACSQEKAGYDRVLIANAATMPESFSIGSFLSGVTSTLGFLMAHRPGVVPPTAAARNLATIDRLSGGRAAVHVIAGADDREVQADGQFNTKEERYRIAAEYVEVMRKVWSSSEPFDFDGEFYKFRGAFSIVKPTGGALPVYWGGTSDQALDLCGKVADVYALGGDTFASAGRLAAKAHSAAKKYGREVKVLMTTVVIVGDTEEQAWAKAQLLYEKVENQIANGGTGIMAKHEKEGDKPASGAFRRMMAQSEEGDRLDRCLWTGLNKAYKGRGNNSVLVGTAGQIVDSLMEYRRLGITRFLLRGPTQDVDAATIGSEVVPVLREKIAEAMAEKKSA